MTVVGAAQQTSFPMAGNGAVLDFCGPFPDGDRIHDFATAVPTHTRMPRAADTPLRPQAPKSALFSELRALDSQPSRPDIKRIYSHRVQIWGPLTLFGFAGNIRPVAGV